MLIIGDIQLSFGDILLSFGDILPVIGDILLTELSHVVQERAEGPKGPEAARPERAEAPSPGHRPGYDGNQEDAL